VSLKAHFSVHQLAWNAEFLMHNMVVCLLIHLSTAGIVSEQVHILSLFEELIGASLYFLITTAITKL